MISDLSCTTKIGLGSLGKELFQVISFRRRLAKWHSGQRYRTQVANPTRRVRFSAGINRISSYILGGCCLEEHKLTLRFPFISGEIVVDYALKNIVSLLW